ncbi:hypothetical protein ACFOET_10060 [Parapedobacter deserti]|uniref:Outer membrane protein beta-barrel domain-containing protein n=1 Tax=Parapedobacter deserti TaxID=1912957 RepID=A0ABV7JL92_9SPHI
MVGRCLILLLISYESIAQTYLGPRFQAMGNTGAALQGIYSLAVNPAGLSALERPTVSLDYQHHFFATDITTQSAMLGVPTRLGTFGLAVRQYGLKGAFDDIKAGFSFAKQLAPYFILGMSASFHQLYVPNYLSTSALSVDVGMQYLFGEGAIVGLQYANVGKADYGSDAYGTIPAYLRIGVSYPLVAVLVSADVVYRAVGSLGGHLGIEYRLGEVLHLRGGLSVNPMERHAGFGFHWQRLTFNTAASFHSRLGTSPQIGLCYAF